MLVLVEDSTNYGSRRKDERGEAGISADRGRRAGVFAIDALGKQPPSRVLRQNHVRRWLDR
jgi:hypothetical protein